MEKNERYIEALDTLIEYYQGKISELEEIKRGLLAEQTRTIVDVQEFYNDEGVNVLRTVWSDGTFTDQLRPGLPRKKERTVVDVRREYCHLTNEWKVYTKYSDGMVGVTYEPDRSKEECMAKKDYERIKKWVNENTHTLPDWGDKYVYVESLLEFLKSITKEEE